MRRHEVGRDLNIGGWIAWLALIGVAIVGRDETVGGYSLMGMTWALWIAGWLTGRGCKCEVCKEPGHQE